MAQSLSKILLHLVFSTRHRRPFIRRELEHEMHAYLAAECQRLGSHAYRVGGTDDQVHIACTLPRTIPVAKLIEAIKTSSSAWMKKRDRERCSRFAWQNGYGAFSLGQSQLSTLVRYIDGQREHHRTRTFDQELLELLRRYEIDFEEGRVLDAAETDRTP